jgi:hypothetical protein
LGAQRGEVGKRKARRLAATSGKEGEGGQVARPDAMRWWCAVQRAVRGGRDGTGGVATRRGRGCGRAGPDWEAQ